LEFKDGYLTIRYKGEELIKIIPTLDFSPQAVQKANTVKVDGFYENFVFFKVMDFKGFVDVLLSENLFSYMIKLKAYRRISITGVYSPLILFFGKDFMSEIFKNQDIRRVIEHAVFSHGSGIRICFRGMELTLNPPSLMAVEDGVVVNHDRFTYLRIFSDASKIFLGFIPKEPLKLNTATEIFLTFSGSISRGLEKWPKNIFLKEAFPEKIEERMLKAGGLLNTNFSPLISLKISLTKYILNPSPLHLGRLLENVLVIKNLENTFYEKIADIFPRLEYFLAFSSLQKFYSPSKFSDIFEDLRRKIAEDKSVIQLMEKCFKMHEKEESFKEIPPVDQQLLIQGSDVYFATLFKALVVASVEKTPITPFSENIIPALKAYLGSQVTSGSLTWEKCTILATLPILFGEKTVELNHIYCERLSEEAYKTVFLLNINPIFQRKPAVGMFSKACRILYIGEKNGVKTFIAFPSGLPSARIYITPTVRCFSIFIKTGKEKPVRIIPNWRKNSAFIDVSFRKGEPLFILLTKPSSRINSFGLKMCL